ncbi:c-type cytochrome [Elioraea thermophila]|uniref:c-type cytochrome n=1 Tax=Elioraea thermophila TaxID=2185104 RepID=UPI0013001E9F|nr:c-type cytochrome [Elioraea thermophila]
MSLRSLPLLGLALAPGLAAAQTLPGDPFVGRQLAERWCASCHLVSPRPVGPAGDGAEPFQSIADRASTTALSLRVFLQTPHGQMPDLQITHREADDLIAYILSLRER